MIRLLLQGLRAGFWLGILEGCWELALPWLVARPGSDLLPAWLALHGFGLPIILVAGSVGAVVGMGLALGFSAWRLAVRREPALEDPPRLQRLLWAALGGLGGLALIWRVTGQAPSRTLAWGFLAVWSAGSGWWLGGLAQRVRRHLVERHTWLPNAGRAFRRVVGIGLVVGWGLIVVQRTGWVWPERASTPSPNAPNVLFIVVDALRADRMSLYGYPVTTTPAIDAFVRRGATVFRDCQAHAAWTRPSVATLLTGRLFPGAEFDQYDLGRVGSRETTLLERFHRVGYRTGWFVANPHLAPEYGLPQQADRLLVPQRSAFVNALCVGWVLRPLWRHKSRLTFPVNLLTWWISVPNGTWYRPWWIRDDELRNAFLTWWRQQPPGHSWFAYLHFMGVHAPYGDSLGQYLWPSQDSTGPQFALEAPARNQTEILEHLAGYEADIRYMDACVGRILELLEAGGELDRTIVVITADHGEEFGEHGIVGHQYAFHREITHVPLILWQPGATAPRWVERPVQHLDVAPTLLALARLPPAEGLLGQSLVEPVGSTAPIAPRSCYHGRYAWGYGVAGLRCGDAQLYVSRTRRGVQLALYDLRRDPREQHNLAPQRPDKVCALLAELHRIDPSVGAD